MELNIKYGMVIDSNIVDKSLLRLTNQIYKLLPIREDDKDWEKPLEMIILELVGIKNILILPEEKQLTFFILLAKLEALNTLKEKDEDTFMLFRRGIFDCLSLLSKIRESD